ncbi:hypothetical protein AAZX31_07G148900 [Glycine max]
MYRTVKLLFLVFCFYYIQQVKKKGLAALIFFYSNIHYTPLRLILSNISSLARNLCHKGHFEAHWILPLTQRGSCIIASLVSKSKDIMAYGFHPSFARLAAKKGVN